MARSSEASDVDSKIAALATSTATWDAASTQRIDGGDFKAHVDALSRIFNAKTASDA